MTDITIPPEAVEAVADELRPYFDTTHSRTFLRDVARAALRAGIAAWPGMEIEVYQNCDEGVYLPLPTPPLERIGYTKAGEAGATLSECVNIARAALDGQPAPGREEA